MLSRHFLRAKALQAIYAGVTSKTTDVEEVVKMFEYNVQRLNNLGLLQLSTLPQLAFVAERNMEAASQKFNPTEAEKNPSRNFVDNKIINGINEGFEYRSLCDKMHIDWSNNPDIFRKIYNALKSTKGFEAYIKSTNPSFEEDKNIALNAFKALMNEDTLRDLIADKDLLWDDDFDQIAQYVYMLVKDIKEEEINEAMYCPQVFDNRNEKDRADYNFALHLAKETMLHIDDNESLIRRHLQNWDMERVALMDILLINMAITEFTCCPSIPERVTVDEYIELSKEFSTEKSKLFVNGILDKILIELRVAGKIEKDERGLYDPELED